MKDKTHRNAATKNMLSKPALLPEEEKDLQNLLDFSPDPLVIVNEKGEILKLNESVEKLLGYTTDELHAQPIETIIPERYRKEHISNRTKFINHPEARNLSAKLNLYALTKDGAEIPVDLSLKPLRVGGALFIVSSLRDVTDRKRMVDELQFLHTLTEYMSETTHFDGALEVAIEMVRGLIQCDYGEAWILDPGKNVWKRKLASFRESQPIRKFADASRNTCFAWDRGLASQIWTAKTPLWINDLAKADHPEFLRIGFALKAGFQYAMALPITANNETIAVLLFFSRCPFYDKRNLRLLSTTQTQIGIVLGHKLAEDSLRNAYAHAESKLLAQTEELGRAYDKLSEEINARKRLEKEILDISETEQERIGQDLHDSLGQDLIAVTYIAKLLNTKLAAKKIPESKEAAEIAKLVSFGIEQIRDLARGLYPVELKTHGLGAALEELAFLVEKRNGIPCRLTLEPTEAMTDDVAIQFYRIAQEALNNAVKHARPKTIEIHFGMKSGRPSLEIKDDGKGLSSTNRNPEGLGLHIMRYRASLIGADLEISSGTVGGTTVRCFAVS